MSEKRLYKGDQRILCGVCSGLADYFNLDPTIVRLGVVLLSCLGFSGLIAYIIAAVIIPDKPVDFQ